MCECGESTGSCVCLCGGTLHVWLLVFSSSGGGPTISDGCTVFSPGFELKDSVEGLTSRWEPERLSIIQNVLRIETFHFVCLLSCQISCSLSCLPSLFFQNVSFFSSLSFTAFCFFVFHLYKARAPMLHLQVSCSLFQVVWTHHLQECSVCVCLCAGAKIHWVGGKKRLMFTFSPDLRFRGWDIVYSWPWKQRRRNGLAPDPFSSSSAPLFLSSSADGFVIFFFCLFFFLFNYCFQGHEWTFNSQYQFLSQHGWEVLKVLRKTGI